MTISSIKPEYSVVVPVYDSGPQLSDLLNRLTSVFETEVKASYEIILVDDGSKNPQTRRMLAELAGISHVLVVRLTRNFGKPGAIMCGLSQSRGDWIVTIDDDLQQRPEDIPKLIVLRDHDMVTATYTRTQHPLQKRITSKIKQLFDRGVLGYTVRLSPLKLIRRHVVDGMLAVTTNRPFIPALIRQVTEDVVAVETIHQKSAYLKSRYTFRKRWSQFSNLLYGNSIFLMFVFTGIGLSLTALSVLLIVTAVIGNLLGHPVQVGWSSLMATMLLVGGLNLAAIGISGQYFIRILEVSSRRPAFIIREMFGACESGEREVANSDGANIASQEKLRQRES